MKAIVFDLDDTLYLERDYAYSGFAAVEAATGWSGLAAMAARRFDEGLRTGIYDHVLGERGMAFDPEMIRKCVEVHRGHVPSIRLLPDARWALGHYAGKLKLGLLSDGYLQAQQGKVEALGLRPSMDAIILTDELGREFWKPDPRSFVHMLERLGCRAGECVYVADNPHKDFIAPRQLGWRTVRVRREGGEHAADEPGPGEHADAEITSLRELEAVI